MSAGFSFIIAKIVASFIGFSLLFFTALPCSAANNVMTVRVGFFAYDGYNEQDNNMLRSGYGYDVLQHIAGYAGLRYEYIGYDKSWHEMIAML